MLERLSSAVTGGAGTLVGELASTLDGLVIDAVEVGTSAKLGT
ncbi:hypothetical protein ACFWU5_16020 [Nocardia sp. NPDC058640]